MRRPACRMEVCTVVECSRSSDARSARYSVRPVPRWAKRRIFGAMGRTNPAARSNPASPIYGMPILDVDQAKSIIVIKRSMGRGYAGIDNELYVNSKTGMLFADAKEGLAALTAAVKAL